MSKFRGPFALLAASALALASLSKASAAEPSNTLPPDLAQALDTYNQATMHNDSATLATIVADNYMLVNSDTSVQDKESYLTDFTAPGFRLDPYVMEQPVFRVVSDAALTGWVFQLGWTQHGRHQTRRLRIAHFWVKQEGRWLIAYTQLTRVPE